MEKNITLPVETNIWKDVTDKLAMPIDWLRRYYGSVVGKEITMRQTALLLNVQAAFAMSALPVEGPLVVRLACCGWFVYALKRCKDEL